MARYTTAARARAEWYEDRPVPPLGQPIAYESDPVDTGLKDSEGRPIYRLPDEIGFLRSDKP